MGEIILKSR